MKWHRVIFDFELRLAKFFLSGQENKIKIAKLRNGNENEKKINIFPSKIFDDLQNFFLPSKTEKMPKKFMKNSDKK